jgi:mannosyltransferase OCH1-like enzyme
LTNKSRNLKTSIPLSKSFGFRLHSDPSVHADLILSHSLVIFIFLPSFQWLKYYFYNDIETYENDSVIPLNIYQVWIGSDIPEKMRELMDKIRMENPEFTMKCFNDEESKQFLKDNFDYEVLDAYNKLIPGSYKSDLMRFALLYVNGGIYLDAKMEPINEFKFKDLIYHNHYLQDDNIDYISSYTDTKANVSTQIIVSRPKNHILLNCITQIVDNVKNKFYGKHTIEVTGPGVLHKYLLEDNIKDYDMKVEKFPQGAIVYVIEDYDDNENKIYKIGKTDDMNKRIKIYNTHSIHNKIIVHYVEILCPLQLETCLRSMLYKYRIKNRKDFFDCSLLKIKKAFNLCIKSIKCIEQEGGMINKITYYENKLNNKITIASID